MPTFGITIFEYQSSSCSCFLCCKQINLPIGKSFDSTIIGCKEKKNKQETKWSLAGDVRIPVLQVVTT